jgi:flagellar L-ring protein FlgH
MHTVTIKTITQSPMKAAKCDAPLERGGTECAGDFVAMDLYLSLVQLQAAERARVAVAEGEDKFDAAFGDGWRQMPVELIALPMVRGAWVRPVAARVGALLILLACSGVKAQTVVASATGALTPLAAAAAPAVAVAAGAVAGAAGAVKTKAQAVAEANARRVNGDGPAASSLDEYLRRVRADNSGAVASVGAIWTDQGRLTRMSTDVRASRPHDLIQVVVEESLAASTDGTVKGSRSSNASSSITGLIGALHAGNALQNLVNQNSASGLSAQGASATNSSLTTTFGGQVVEVLPNGMLVIEAARQVEFSQQTQTIILRGLVRPEDISQQNQVLSTAISSLELQVRGKGIVNDQTRRQNVLVRMLESILVF